MDKQAIIRTIYLYLFALLGLVLLTIGGVRFIDMGLKTWVFTKADEEQRLNYKRPAMVYPVEQIQKISDTQQLTAEEKAQIDNWLRNYENWQEQQANFDYVTSRRQREASLSLALILLGLPLYYFHWRIIRREAKDQKG